jgi:hypothetical protein
LTVHPPMQRIDYLLQKRLISIIFSAICILGILASAFPSQCSQTIHFRRKTNDFSSNYLKVKKVRIQGHHPMCNEFAHHTVRLYSKTYCTGCLGMIIGALLSLFGTVFYQFITFDFQTAVIIFWIGFLIIGYSLLQSILFGAKSVSARLFFNITFVLGTFFILTGVSEIGGSLVLYGFLFSLIIYWILTRIILSRWKHRKICASCKVKSCNLYNGWDR